MTPKLLCKDENPTKFFFKVQYIYCICLFVFRSGHYDPDAVRACAQTVALHWQTLMLRIEDRLKLVNASAAFYRTSQQVRDRALRKRRGKNTRLDQD